MEYKIPEDVIEDLKHRVTIEEEKNKQKVYRVFEKRLGGKDFDRSVLIGFASASTYSEPWMLIVWAYKNVLGIDTMICKGSDMIVAIHHASEIALASSSPEEHIMGIQTKE